MSGPVTGSLGVRVPELPKHPPACDFEHPIQFVQSTSYYPRRTICQPARLGLPETPDNDHISMTIPICDAPGLGLHARVGMMSDVLRGGKMRQNALLRQRVARWQSRPGSNQGNTKGRWR